MPGFYPSLTGPMFDDELAFFMSQALGDNRDASADTHALSQIDRERIAWAVAHYYQCAHCLRHHHRIIVDLQKKTGETPWLWEKYIRRLVYFFTRAKKSEVTKEEWAERQEQWEHFIHLLGKEHGRVMTLAMLAISFACDDTDLMANAFETMGNLCADIDRLEGVVRDVFRITIAMKAATTKFRVEATVVEQIKLLRQSHAGQQVPA
jgi:hypothetical protein